MKAKTTNSTQNCLNFISGYSLSLENPCTINFNSGGFILESGNTGLDQITPSQPTNVYYTSVSRSAAYNPKQTWCFKLINFTMNSIFYNSGDSELKDPLGPFIIENTITCNGYNF